MGKKQKPLDYRAAAEVYLQAKEALATKLYDEAISSFEIGKTACLGFFKVLNGQAALRKQYEACVKEQEIKTFEKLLRKVARMLTNCAHNLMRTQQSPEALAFRLFDQNSKWLEEYKLCPEMLIKNYNNLSLLWKKQKQFQRALYFLNTAMNLLGRYPHLPKGSTLLNLGSLYSASSQ